MKKPLLIITGVSIALIGAVAYTFRVQAPTTPSSASIDRPSTTNTSSNATSSPQAMMPGKYVDYSEQALAASQGTRLLFFHAEWCSQCRTLEADIKRSGVPADVTIYKVDYDNNHDLRKKYGVTLQTTVVRVDSGGNLVKKFVAYDKPSVASVQDNLLR